MVPKHNIEIGRGKRKRGGRGGREIERLRGRAGDKTHVRGACEGVLGGDRERKRGKGEGGGEAQMMINIIQ